MPQWRHARRCLCHVRLSAKYASWTRLTVDERVQDGHCSVGDTSVRVNLLENCRCISEPSSNERATKDKTRCPWRHAMRQLTLVDVGAVGLLAGLARLLLLSRGSGGLLSSLLLLGRSLSASWGLAASAGLLLSSLGSHLCGFESWELRSGWCGCKIDVCDKSQQRDSFGKGWWMMDGETGQEQRGRGGFIVAAASLIARVGSQQAAPIFR